MLKPHFSYHVFKLPFPNEDVIPGVSMWSQAYRPGPLHHPLPLTCRYRLAEVSDGTWIISIYRDEDKNNASGRKRHLQFIFFTANYVEFSPPPSRKDDGIGESSVVVLPSVFPSFGCVTILPLQKGGNLKELGH